MYEGSEVSLSWPLHISSDDEALAWTNSINSFSGYECWLGSCRMGKLHEKYKLGEEIGRGKSAVIYRCVI